MARGWESKAVEAQQMEAKEASPSQKRQRSPEEIHRIREQQTLQLARAKVKRELEGSNNPRHAQMLNQALSDLDKKLAALK
jgi:hypothetical protein